MLLVLCQGQLLMLLLPLLLLLTRAVGAVQAGA